MSATTTTTSGTSLPSTEGHLGELLLAIEEARQAERDAIEQYKAAQESRRKLTQALLEKYPDYPAQRQAVLR